MPDSVSRLDLNLIRRNNSPLSHSFRPTQDPRTLDEPAVESLSLIRPLFLRCPACNFTGVCAICHLGQTFPSSLDCTETCFHSGSFFADRYPVRRADGGIRRYRGSPSAFSATKSSSGRGKKGEDTFDNLIVLRLFFTLCKTFTALNRRLVLFFYFCNPLHANTLLLSSI